VVHMHVSMYLCVGVLFVGGLLCVCVVVWWASLSVSEKDDLPSDDGDRELPPLDTGGDLPNSDGDHELPTPDGLPPMSMVGRFPGMVDRFPDKVESYPMTKKAIAKLGVQPHTIQALKKSYAIVGATPDSCMEVFCPPRVCPAFERLGAAATVSADIVTRWDLSQQSHRTFLMELARRKQPQAVLLSPPCLPFSQMQRTNVGRSDPALVAAKLSEGREFVKFSMTIARAQIAGGRCFVYEHPSHASSWQQQSVTSVSKLKGVRIVQFDQCRFGAVTLVNKTPIRKPTKFMTNSSAVAEAFDGKLCRADHEHQRLDGQEGGVSRTTAAAAYPQALVDALVAALVAGDGDPLP
jgi:hypothetical protein